MQFEDLMNEKILGVFTSVATNGYNYKSKYLQADNILFETEEGVYAMYHAQDCCENVYIEDFGGTINELIGEVIKSVEESTDNKSCECWKTIYTFYHISTMNTSLCLRWCGTSNGYYSVGVSFVKMFEKKNGKYFQITTAYHDEGHLFDPKTYRTFTEDNKVGVDACVDWEIINLKSRRS